jgi:aminomethyltransferase
MEKVKSGGKSVERLFPFLVRARKLIVGREALVRQKDRGVTRKLMGFEMTGRGIGRDGYEVCINGEGAGWVTSGGPSPSLSKNIGLCYLPAAHAAPGRPIQILVRGQVVDAVTVPAQFYRRTT